MTSVDSSSGMPFTASARTSTRAPMRGRFLLIASVAAGTGAVSLDGDILIAQHGVEGAGGAIAVHGTLDGALTVGGLP